MEKVKRKVKKTRQRGKEPHSLHRDWTGDKNVLNNQTKEEKGGRSREGPNIQRGKELVSLP